MVALRLTIMGRPVLPYVLAACFLAFVTAASASTLDFLVSGTVTSVINRTGTSGSPPAVVGDSAQFKISYDPATPPSSTYYPFYGGVVSQYAFAAGAATVSVRNGASNWTVTDVVTASTIFNVPGGGCQGFLAFGVLGQLSFTGVTSSVSISMNAGVFNTPPIQGTPPLLRSASLPASDADLGSLAPSGDSVPGCPPPSSAYSVTTTIADWDIVATLDPSTIQIGPIQPPPPVIALSRSTLDFGIVDIGSVRDLSVMLTNQGTGLLQGTVSAVAPYSIGSSSALQLQPGQSTNIMVRFAPTAAVRSDQTLPLTFIGGSAALQVVGTGAPSTSQAPNIGKVPPTFAVGSSVVIEGRNFGFTQGASTLTLGGTAVTILGWYDTLIRFVVPVVPATTQTLRLATSRGSTAASVTVVGPAPIIEKLSDSSTSVGSTLAIWGQNFGASQGTSTITIGGVTASVVQWNDKFITARVPELLVGSHAVIVTTSSGRSYSVPLRVRRVIATVKYDPCAIAVDFSAYFGKWFSPVCPPLVITASPGKVAGTVDLKIQNITTRWYKLTAVAGGTTLPAALPLVVAPEGTYTVQGLALAANQFVSFAVDANAVLATAFTSLDYTTKFLQLIGYPVSDVPRDKPDLVALVAELLKKNENFLGFVTQTGACIAKGEFTCVIDTATDLIQFIAEDPAAKDLAASLGITGLKDAAIAARYVKSVVAGFALITGMYESLIGAPVYATTTVVGR